MKYLIFSLLICITFNSYSQPVAAEQVAAKIADNLKDSLDLTSSQRAAIYDINIQLNNKKMLAREQYNGSDSLRFYIQSVENTRDNLYRPVIGDEKFVLYLQKKRNLIRTN